MTQAKDDLFEEIAAAHVDTKRIRCPVAKALRDMTEESAASLQKSLDNPSYDGTIIAEVMTNRGFKMSDDAVQRHRRNVCSCRGK